MTTPGCGRRGRTQTSLDNSRQGSPSSLRVPSKSPESQSVASLEFDNHTSDASKNFDDKKADLEREDSKEIFSPGQSATYNGVKIDNSKTSCSPYAEWTLLLTMLFSQGVAGGTKTDNYKYKFNRLSKAQSVMRVLRRVFWLKAVRHLLVQVPGLKIRPSASVLALPKH